MSGPRPVAGELLAVPNDPRGICLGGLPIGTYKTWGPDCVSFHLKPSPEKRTNSESRQEPAGVEQQAAGWL